MERDAGRKGIWGKRKNDQDRYTPPSIGRFRVAQILPPPSIRSPLRTKGNVKTAYSPLPGKEFNANTIFFIFPLSPPKASPSILYEPSNGNRHRTHLNIGDSQQ
jgi:hypothetical protein